MFKSKKAFTLIELLIVIALLGALAVGLLAALDPFEQLKKGTDTGVRNLVSEVQGAVIRYYALRGEMPYCASADCSAEIAADDLPSSTNLSSSPMADAVSNIIGTGELKQDFTALAGANQGRVFVTGDANTVSVCFLPQSRSFKCDPNTKFNQDGTEEGGTLCGDAATCGTQTLCYWCVK